MVSILTQSEGGWGPLIRGSQALGNPSGVQSKASGILWGPSSGVEGPRGVISTWCVNCRWLVRSSLNGRRTLLYQKYRVEWLEILHQGVFQYAHPLYFWITYHNFSEEYVAASKCSEEDCLVILPAMQAISSLHLSEKAHSHPPLNAATACHRPALHTEYFTQHSFF